MSACRSGLVVLGELPGARGPERHGLGAVNVLPKEHWPPTANSAAPRNASHSRSHQRADYDRDEEQERDQVPREDRDQRNRHADREPEIAAERPALHALEVDGTAHVPRDRGEPGEPLLERRVRHEQLCKR
jgi:hypothetical protein